MFESLFLIGCWVVVPKTLIFIEGFVSAFRNGMTLAYSSKNDPTNEDYLSSNILGQILGKTLRGYLGPLNTFFYETKATVGCPLMGRLCFWGQKPNLKTSFSGLQIPTPYEIKKVYGGGGTPIMVLVHYPYPATFLANEYPFPKLSI